MCIQLPIRVPWTFGNLMPPFHRFCNNYWLVLIPNHTHRKGAADQPFDCVLQALSKLAHGVRLNGLPSWYGQEWMACQSIPNQGIPWRDRYITIRTFKHIRPSTQSKYSVCHQCNARIDPDTKFTSCYFDLLTMYSSISESFHMANSTIRSTKIGWATSTARIKLRTRAIRATNQTHSINKLKSMLSTNQTHSKLIHMNSYECYRQL